MSLRPLTALTGLAVTLAGCATVRMHSPDELAALGRQCGLTAGELMQDEELPRVLVLMRPGASTEERACVARWSRRNHLHLAWIEAVAGDGE